MKMNRETLMSILRWATLCIGLFLLAISWQLAANGSPRIGFALNIGSLGWLLASLLLAPAVHRKLFGTSHSSASIKAA